MRKWLLTGIFALIAGLVVLMPAKVQAYEIPVVHITVSAYIVAAPSGLILTYVSDTQVDVSWAKGVDAVNTMVRVKYDSAPANRDDGYLVYYGGGEFVSDTNVDFTSPRVPYYRAWSERVDGHWEPYGVSGEANFMSMSYLWIGLIVLALGLSVIGITFRRPLFATLAAFGWVLCMVFAYYLTNIEVQLYQALQLFFLLCFLGMLVSAYIAVRQNQPEEKPPETYVHTEHLRKTIDRYRAMRRRL